MSRSQPKLGPEQSRQQIGHVRADLETIAAIMVCLGNHAPDDEVHPEWLAFFGSAIDRASDRLEGIEEALS